MSAPDVDATVTRCRELAEFMRKQGAVTGAEAFDEAAAALLALRAERDRFAKEAGDNMLSTAAIMECRHVIREIMGGNLAFVEDDVARCLLTLRDERESLRAERDALRAVVIPHVEDLEKCAAIVDEYPEFARTAAQFKLAANELRAALAPASQTPAGKGEET